MEPPVKATIDAPIKIVVYTPELWAELEGQRERMLAARKEELFAQHRSCRDQMKKLEAEIVTAVGDPAKANREMLLSEVKASGDSGAPLSDLRRLIGDPNHLNKARESLLEPKDADGKSLATLIEEKRGENNELRLFLLKKKEQE